MDQEKGEKEFEDKAEVRENYGEQKKKDKSEEEIFNYPINILIII